MCSRPFCVTNHEQEPEEAGDFVISYGAEEG